jgi:hypothetical protein
MTNLCISKLSKDAKALDACDARITFVNQGAIPENLSAAAGEQLLIQLHAEGVQVYICEVGPDGKKSWVLKMPEAKLFEDRGSEIGSHFAGPTWRHQDGSQISGRAVARTESPAPDAIPWLLLTVTERSGTGIFEKVSSIQRLNTRGGKVHGTVDDSAKAGEELRVSYSGDYLFYAPKG